MPKTEVRRRGGRDLTTGSIPKTLFHQAWPQTTEGVLLIIDQVSDLIWAGRLPSGFRSVAGIGVSQTITQVGQTARSGLDQSTRALISRSVGAKNMELANDIAIQSLVVSAIYAVLLVIFGILFTDVMLRLIGTSGGVSAEAAAYMRVRFGNVATIGLRQTGSATLQATGEVMIPLRAGMVTRVIHFALSPCLVFGWWIFPHMGIAGAAMAGLLGDLGGGAITYYVLFRGNSNLHLTLKGFRFRREILRQLLKIGAPASLVGMERSITQLVLLRIVTPFGDIPTTAYAITKRLENLLNFGSMGVGTASGVMVGQSLGAGNVSRAKKTIWWAVLFGNILPAVVRIFIILSPTALILLFSDRTDVVDLTSSWLGVQVYASMALGTAMVFQQSYNIAGDTMFPLILIVLTEWTIEIPTALFLSHTSVGPIAIPYAALADGLARVVGFSAYFFTGRWYRVRVIPPRAPKPQTAQRQI